MKPLLTVALPFLLLAGAALAQHTHHEEAAVSPEKLGRVEFATSCNAAAQPHFDRAMTMLHSFWYSEARKAFQAAADADPQCGISLWGVAMTWYHPLWAPPTSDELKAGSDAAMKAKAAGAKSARERDYIDAIHEFYRDAPTRDHKSRARAFETAMQNLRAKYPDDREAAIFHALTLDATAAPTDKSYANQKKAGAILEPIFAKHPDHPGLAHYIIHSYDVPPLAAQALPAAKVYAKIAPDSPHALHMPSHIFVRLGLWDDAVASNLDSARAARNFIAKSKPGATSFEELHALDYLVYAWLQTGEDTKAKQAVETVSAIAKVDAEEVAAAYAIAAIPARYALERRDWRAAMNLRIPSAVLAWEKFPQAEALVIVANAIGAAQLGEKEAAGAAIERLKALEQKLRDRPDPYWASQVEISRLAAEGWLACASGDEALATARLRAAAELEESTEKHPVTPGSVLPAREMVADHLLMHGRGADALEAYERSLRDAANRYNSLSGAARAAQIAGDRKKAGEYYLRTAALLAERSKPASF
jgi:hypothetical protein